MMDLLEGDEKRALAAETVADRKEAFRRGFHFYGRYVYDCARLFDTLPSQGYLAAGAGLSAISDRPFINAGTENGALVLESPAVFRLSGGRAAVRVSRADGSALPEITDDPLGWIEWGTQEGVFRHELGTERAPVLYIRSQTPIRAVLVEE